MDFGRLGRSCGLPIRLLTFRYFANATQIGADATQTEGLRDRESRSEDWMTGLARAVKNQEEERSSETRQSSGKRPLGEDEEKVKT